MNNQWNPATTGDTITNETTKQTWEAVECPSCHGIGLISVSYIIVIKCPMCIGNKIIWKVSNVSKNNNNLQKM